MRLVLSLLCVALASASEPQLAPASVCKGYGHRLEQRLLHQPSSHGPEPAALDSAYAGFVDTVLRGFKGARWLSERVAGAFESEAERFIDRTFSSASASQAFARRSSSNSTSAAQNASTEANGTAAARNGSGLALFALRPQPCLSWLYRLLMDRFDARPPSFVQPASASAGEEIVLLSGGDRNAALAERVVANHAAFARRHGYAHWWHKGSLVAERGWLGYWHKVVMMRQAMERFPDASAWVWVDDDIIFTSFADDDDDMIRAALRARPNASVLVTRDPGATAKLNTGVVIVRNSADGAGRDVLDELLRRAAVARDDLGGLSLATAPQSACLHEQQALEEMLQLPDWRSHVTILEQRAEVEAAAPAWNLNTFLRWSHYNAERDENMRFEGDRHGSGWRPGDFAGHCSGLSPLRRALCVAVLIGAVIS